MAKKKSGGPQKACVGCGEMIHARKKVCDKCGVEQPMSEPAKKKSAKKSARKKTAKKKSVSTSTRTSALNLEAVGAAADFIATMGGTDRAKQALAEVEKIAKKVS